jgi:hypothetical protein
LHIFFCHKKPGISLAKKYKSFKFSVKRATDYTSRPLLI